MLCITNSSCLKGYQCIFNHCVKKNDDINYNNKLILPIIGIINYDHSSLHSIYFGIFIFIILIGFINNIFSLTTFIRKRIRDTTCGIYLIIYSICSLILMILLLTNIIIVIYYNNYFIRLWACHGYPYLSLIMVYTTILISTAIAIEGVFIHCFKINPQVSTKRLLIILILIFLIVFISSFDKIFTRYLITNRYGNYHCLLRKSPYQLSSKILFCIFIIIPCSIHLVCLIKILSIRSQQNLLQKIFYYQTHIIPSLIFILCLFLNGLYRWIFQFGLIVSSESFIRIHIIFLFLYYMPQIFTYMIYISPNNIYVREFYQIWFYKKFCCCFYNKRRHIQDFENICYLWSRRTSLETIKTIATLDDIYCDTEVYKKPTT